MQSKGHDTRSPRFTVFAGPCSAESRSQLETVAGFINQWNSSHLLKINALRAGAWKPRTHPGEFEGYGTQAHYAALRRLGPCPQHRLTYKGVAAPESVTCRQGELL